MTPKDLEEHVEKIAAQVEKIHNVLVGDLDKPGGLVGEHQTLWSERNRKWKRKSDLAWTTISWIWRVVVLGVLAFISNHVFGKGGS